MVAVFIEKRYYIVAYLQIFSLCKKNLLHVKLIRNINRHKFSQSEKKV